MRKRNILQEAINSVHTQPDKKAKRSRIEKRYYGTSIKVSSKLRESDTTFTQGTLLFMF